ncbi:MAG: carboxypeptidase-like regulatory domain-containing protein, partial [Anaerolineales bacterium]
MSKQRNASVFLCCLMLALSSCTLASPFSARTPPPANPLDQGESPEPAAEVLIDVIPPVGTSNDAVLSLELLDLVTGLDYNAYRIPLERQDNGHYLARLTPRVGSLLSYRYVRTAPAEAIEVSTGFEPIRIRTAYIPGPTQFSDVIAGWSDTPYTGPTGRIIGRVFDALTGQALPERVISAGGLSTFSDGEGRFRIDGLPPGVHQVTVFSPSGSHLPVQQGAIIAGDASTPVELGMQPANPVHVTFELTVPSSTP